MAINEHLTNRIREALSVIPDIEIEEKKMFRGITFMVNKKMCLSIGGERIMCRIDPLVYESAIKKEGCSAVIMKGKEYKGYVNINEEAIKNDKDLKYWIDLALAYNEIAKVSKKKK